MLESNCSYFLIERRGITAVPRVLWSRQDQVIQRIKAAKKIIEKLLRQGISDRDEIKGLWNTLIELSRSLVDMVFRENNILYPILNVLLSDGEWLAIRNEEGLIGYYKVKPGNTWSPRAKPIYPYQLTPSLTQKQLKMLPNSV